MPPATDVSVSSNYCPPTTRPRAIETRIGDWLGQFVTVRWHLFWMRSQLCRICPDPRFCGYHSRQDWIESHTKQSLRFDDLIPEESENVQRAIKRLPAKEAYDRVFRIRRAFQVRQAPSQYRIRAKSNKDVNCSAPSLTLFFPPTSRSSPRR
jgi:hypothetical protein